MSVYFPTRCKCSACGVVRTGRAYITDTTYPLPPNGQPTHALLMSLPKGWKHTPCVNFCGKCLRRRAAQYKRRGESDPMEWS